MKVKKFVACRRGTVWALGVATQVVERVSRSETVTHGWNAGEAWAKAFPGTTANERLGDYTELLEATTLKDAKAKLAEVEAAWHQAVMDRARSDDAVPLVVTRAELKTLLDGVDSHRYWQLADSEYRHDGFVMEPGSDDPEKVEAIEECDALEAKLEGVQRCVEAEAVK